MPIKKSFRKFKKRFMRKRRQYRVRRPLPLIGFPETKLVRMRYSDGEVLNPLVSGIVSKQIRANGINDPYYSAGGHRPIGYNEWANFYKQYTVVGSRITVKFQNDATSNVAGSVACGLYKTNSTTIPSTIINMKEQGLSKWRSLSTIVSASNGVSLSQSFSSKRFFGYKNLQDADYQRIEFGADPATTQTCYFTFWVSSEDPTATNDPGNVLVTYVVDYLVLLQNPLRLTQSS